MDHALNERIRSDLAAQKAEILRHLADESSGFRELLDDMDPKDLVDIATEDIDRKTLQALGDQEVRRLNLIESALARLENDRYGICMQCGSQIPRKRLEAIPYVLLCVDCKSQDERRRR